MKEIFLYFFYLRTTPDSKSQEKLLKWWTVIYTNWCFNYLLSKKNIIIKHRSSLPATLRMLAWIGSESPIQRKYFRTVVRSDLKFLIFVSIWSDHFEVCVSIFLIIAFTSWSTLTSSFLYFGPKFLVWFDFLFFIIVSKFPIC
jgi:hypothetical protein